MKRFKTITSIVDTSLTTSTVLTGGVFIAVFPSGVGLPVGVALSGTSQPFSLAAAITRKYFKNFTIKQGKHDAIKLLGQSKLDSIADIISNQAETKLRQITNNSGNNYLNKEEKKAAKIFYEKSQILQISRV